MDNTTINVRINSDEFNKEVARIREATERFSIAVGVGSASMRKAFQKLSDAFKNQPKSMFEFETLKHQSLMRLRSNLSHLSCFFV